MNTKQQWLLRLFAWIILPAISHTALAQSWTQTSAPSNHWMCVACSADGVQLLAVSGGNSEGPMYTSHNAGATWSPTSTPFHLWQSTACSADGTVLAAAGTDASCASANSGATWTPSGFSAWTAVAASGDGRRLVATSGGNYRGTIYTSIDKGATWRATGAPLTNWMSIACSADGAKLVAVARGFPSSDTNFGSIFVSTNGGAAWTRTTAPMADWTSVASSTDGTKLVAVVGSSNSDELGGIYRSTNSGINWTRTSAPVLYWTSVACSCDGSHLAASSSFPPGPIYVSTDGGDIWLADDAPMANWSSVAMSADGAKLVAAVNGGGIYTAQMTLNPSLLIAASGTNAVLSWIIPSVPFTLQQNLDLTTSNWTDVVRPPVLNLTNLRNQVVVFAPSRGIVLYRLKH